MSTSIQVYSQISTDAVYRSVYLRYTDSIQRYTGIQVYRSTGIQSQYTMSIQSGSRIRYTVYSVYRVYGWYTVTIMVPGIQWYTGLQPSQWLSPALPLSMSSCPHMLPHLPLFRQYCLFALSCVCCEDSCSGRCFAWSASHSNSPPLPSTYLIQMCFTWCRYSIAAALFYPSCSHFGPFLLR